MRVYLDNGLITYLVSTSQGKEEFLKQQIESLERLSSDRRVEFLLSEESLAEIGRLPPGSVKRQGLEQMYHKLKQSGVIRNSSVAFDDPIATFDSPDVFFDHPYTDVDLDAVCALLKSKGNANDFDARYIANAMLPANRIDVFLTADKKSIWNHRADIKARFGVTVKLPSELAQDLASPPGE